MNLNTFGLMIQADIPTLLEDAIGIGKTALLVGKDRTGKPGGIAKALGFEYVHTEVLSRCDSTDIGGIPRDAGEWIERKPLKWIKQASERPTLIFFDEVSLAPRLNLAACLKGIDERMFADLYLHPASRIVSAMNPSEVTGASFPPQMANRYAHIRFTDLVPLSAWVEGMVGGFPIPTLSRLPETWRTLIPKHRTLIAAFCSRMSTEAFRMPKDLEHAWPSRRTWDMAASASAACEAGSEDDSLAIASLVGEGAALSYVAWRNQQDLGNPADALKDPANYPLPKEDEKLFILLSAVAGLAVSKKDGESWVAAWTMLGRACDAGQADVGATAARVLAGQQPKGVRPPKAIEKFLPILQAARG